ncbi:hypothetical protein DMC47_38895 [Nostoc sp. 3335mG]|nr:hypothetical protein DMC47_38895 [Nostoc sp. 3335mG]
MTQAPASQSKAISMNAISPYPPDKLAKLKSLAEVHEQLAAELKMEVAVLSQQDMPTEALMVAKATARRLLAFRHRLRGAHIPVLGEAFMQDPALELLLEAFARQVEGRQLSLTGLHNYTESSQTTALRWGSRICDVGLALRSADPSDHRREWFTLGDELFSEIAALLIEIAPPASL